MKTLNETSKRLLSAPCVSVLNCAIEINDLVIELDDEQIDSINEQAETINEKTEKRISG